MDISRQTFSPRRRRKGFSMADMQQQFIEEGLITLNRLANFYEYFHWIDNIFETYDEDAMRWHEDHGAKIYKHGDTFFISTTEEYIQNIKSLINRPVPFKTVILKPISEKFLNPELIESKPYIKTDVDTDSVIISAEEKGSDLVIEDILFGSKGLMVVEDENILDYEINSWDGNTLVLDVDIEDEDTYRWHEDEDEDEDVVY